MRTILVLMDSLNREYLKPYNPDSWVITPNINQFAEDSLICDKHYVGSAPCMPARRDFLTGRLNFLDRNWGPMEPFDCSLPKILKENNIFSHIITDHDHYMEAGGEGYMQQFQTWDYIRGQEYDPWISRVTPAPVPEKYYGQRFKQYDLNRQMFTTDDTYPTPVTFQHAIEWLHDNKGEDNYFLQVEVFSPHEPFNAPQEFLDLYEDDYDGPDFDSSTYRKVTEPPEAIAHLKKKYAAGLTMTDKWFGKFMDTIKELGLYDDTLIILTTDHGHLLGEHGYTGKNYMHQYNRISNIPLFIRMPGVECAGRRSDAITQNIDLMPTFLDGYGIDIPESVKGVSLFPFTDEKLENTRKFALYGTFGGAVNIFDGTYNYFRAPKDSSNKPLNYYTSFPVTFLKFLAGDCDKKEIEMGRYLKHTEWPVYKIPAKFPIMQLYSTAEFKDTLLFDWKQDWKQENPIKDESIEAEMIEKLLDAMKWADSPEDQYARLGLEHLL